MESKIGLGITYGIHTSHFMTGLTDTGHPKNWACDSQNKCSQDEDHSGIDAECLECFPQLSDLIVNYEMCEYRRGITGYRDNNFDFLRVFAALMVIYGHGWILSTNTGPGFWGVPFARIGLDIFFSISGYMVTGSWLRTADLRSFLAKRALRILPGLTACVLFTTFVLGARLTRLPLSEYLTSQSTFKYLANIVLHPVLYLPGVFEGMKLGGAVNGSLWSLFPEALCYLTVPMFAMLAIRPRMWGWG